jgi:hypothetical protein
LWVLLLRWIPVTNEMTMLITISQHCSHTEEVTSDLASQFRAIPYVAYKALFCVVGPLNQTATCNFLWGPSQGVNHPHSGAYISHVEFSIKCPFLKKFNQGDHNLFCENCLNLFKLTSCLTIFFFVFRSLNPINPSHPTSFIS